MLCLWRRWWEVVDIAETLIVSPVNLHGWSLCLLLESDEARGTWVLRRLSEWRERRAIRVEAVKNRRCVLRSLRLTIIELLTSLSHSTSVVEPWDVKRLEALRHSFHSVILFLVEVLRVPEGLTFGIGCIKITLCKIRYSIYSGTYSKFACPIEERSSECCVSGFKQWLIIIHVFNLVSQPVEFS